MHPTPPSQPPARAASPDLYRPFFRAGIVSVLTLGAAWGVYLLLRIASSRSFTAIGIHEVNAHGHAQIFGWVGLFVMGFAYHVFPGVRQTTLNGPRWARVSLWLMAGGLVTRSLCQALVPLHPWMGLAAVAGSIVEILAIVLFLALLLPPWARALVPMRAGEFYVLAALSWFLVQALYGTGHLVAMLLAPDRDALLAQIATWQAPLRDLQIHGFAMTMILGVSHWLLHGLFGLPRPNGRTSLRLLVVIQLAIVGEAAGFVLMRLVGHAWAAGWMTAVLALAVGVTLQVRNLGLWSPTNSRDRSLKFIRTAYGWLLVSLWLLVLLPLYQFALLPAFAPASHAAQLGFSHAYYGAVRHAITVGFVSLTIMGVAARVVPAFGGRSSASLSSLWLPFALLNLGCLLRVSGQIATDFDPGWFVVAGASGLFEIAALALWGVHLWGLLSCRERQAERRTYSRTHYTAPRECAEW